MALLIVRLLAWVICSLGLIWQLHYVSKLYFSYVVVTGLQLIPGFESPQKVPHVAICSHYVFGNYTQFLHGRDPVDIPLEEYFKESPDALMTIGSKKSFVLEEKKICSKSYVECDRAEKFFKNGKICYAFGSSKELHLAMSTRKEVMRVNVRTEYLVPVKNKRNEDEENFAHIMPPNSHLFNIGGYDFGGGVLYRLIYRRTRTLLLKPPYQDCWDYKEFGFESRRHCYEACLANQTIARLGKVDIKLVALTPHKYPLCRNCTTEEDDQKCVNQCQTRDCEDEYYETFQYDMRSEDGSSGIRLDPDRRVDRVVTGHPAVNLIEFLTYTLGCVSFWLAWSPMDFLQSEAISKVYAKVARLTPRVAPAKHTCGCTRAEFEIVLHRQQEFLSGMTRIQQELQRMQQQLRSLSWQ